VHWLYLTLAIALETGGTICIKLSDGFSKLAPSVLLFIFYGLSVAAFIFAVKAREKARQEAEAAKAAKQAQAKAEREAGLAAREKAQREEQEAREKARQEAEAAKAAKQAQADTEREAGLAAREKAQREEQEAREKARQEAETAKAAKQAQPKAEREAGLAAREKTQREEQEAREKARQEAETAKVAKQAQSDTEREARLAAGTELYEGTVTLTIMPPIDLDQMRELEECLRRAESLRLVLVGGSIDEGGMIVLSVERPTPLIDVLRAMPPVEQVVKEDMKLMVRLKSPPVG